MLSNSPCPPPTLRPPPALRRPNSASATIHSETHMRGYLGSAGRALELGANLPVQLPHLARADRRAPQPLGNVFDLSHTHGCKIHLQQRFFRRVFPPPVASIAFPQTLCSTN